MRQPTSTFAAACLVPAALVMLACENNRDAAVRGLTGPSALSSASIAAEPASIAAEFRSSPTCRDDMPFDAQVTINVRARRALFIRRFGFEFFDHFGRRVIPFVFPGTATDLTNAVVPPIPIPTSYPIPFPGQTQMPSVQVPSGAFHRFPFRLQFDCGVKARGTLFMAIETADARDSIDVARVSVQIGQ